MHSYVAPLTVAYNSHVQIRIVIPLGKQCCGGRNGLLRWYVKGVNPGTTHSLVRSYDLSVASWSLFAGCFSSSGVQIRVGRFGAAQVNNRRDVFDRQRGFATESGRDLQLFGIDLAAGDGVLFLQAATLRGAGFLRIQFIDHELFYMRLLQKYNLKSKNLLTGSFSHTLYYLFIPKNEPPPGNRCPLSTGGGDIDIKIALWMWMIGNSSKSS